MHIAGMSGNEIYCLHLKGLAPGEIVVGNSVCSLGLVGGLGAWGQGSEGGEIAGVTGLISEVRHAALSRMEKEAHKHGAIGVTNVVSELGSMSGYTEFLSQGTAVHGAGDRFFTTAASGMQLYCDLDAGYKPIRFAMGNVAYALGLNSGLDRFVRAVGRGEVLELSKMYNQVRQIALQRLREEAHKLGANAVVDVRVRVLPYGPSALEMLMTGTASYNPGLGNLAVEDLVTSELTGEEVWNLAKMGLVPVQLMMATSVYSLGVVGGIGTALRGITRGELPELTSLVHGARENCLDLLRKEAQASGADQMVGNKLQIRELYPGLVEVMAVGTAVRRAPGMEPLSPALIPQAFIVDRDTMDDGVSVASHSANPVQQAAGTGDGRGGIVVLGFAALFLVSLAAGGALVTMLVRVLSG